jgi:N-acetyl-alpha-D-muramate 1-phosphate uridylyltransferase
MNGSENTEQIIDTAMLFAAGMGSRMRHLTEHSPKSLIPVLGKPILHYVLELCGTYPFKKIVINTHYLHKKIEESVELFRESHPDFPQIITMYEKELLETGGAIKNAIDIIGNKPVFAMNTDSIIVCKHNIFQEMLNKWQGDKMEFLLLLQEYGQATGYKGRGDFELAADGRVSRPDIDLNYSYLYAGIQILNPDSVARNPSRIFSLREYYLHGDRIYGTSIIDTKCYHATTPEDLIEIEQKFRKA